MKFKKIISNIFKSIRINLKWICFKFFSYKPKVLSETATIQLIIDKKLSISRFGDGEFRLMTKKGKIGFQDADEKLSNDLIKAFQSRGNNLLICSFDFEKKRPMNNYAGKWLKSFVFYRYKEIKNFFDRNYCYGNAEITRFYNPAFFKTTDFDYLTNTYIPFLKKIWSKRNIIIVEGEQTKLGSGNDLFDDCLSIRRIICPARNAFDKIEQITSSVLKHFSAGDLVLLALGPTASVLAVRLCTDFGIQCIDIGHIDVIYCWFMKRCTVPCNIDGKYVNEALPSSPSISCEFDEEKFNKEIVEFVL